MSNQCMMSKRHNGALKSHQNQMLIESLLWTTVLNLPTCKMPPASPRPTMPNIQHMHLDAWHHDKDVRVRIYAY